MTEILVSNKHRTEDCKDSIIRLNGVIEAALLRPGRFPKTVYVPKKQQKLAKVLLKTRGLRDLLKVKVF